MKISKLVLKAYKRLMLSNTRYFEWSPKSNILLLLGSNGSGKSSVLEELTPCPAHHSQFEKGGVKEFHCSHNNHQYVLLSVYDGGSGKHSFIMDGTDELNPGGTFAVQKDLVLKHFNLDRSMHEVLIGLTPFTAMPTSKRREVLTKMSPIDLSFVFGQYNTVKGHQRDALGVINHKTRRMSSENIDLPSDGEMQIYRDEITTLTERLQSLYRARGNAPIEFDSPPDFQTQYQSLRAHAKQIMESQPNEAILYGLSSRSALDSLISVEAHQAQTSKTQLEELANELDEVQRQKVPEVEFGTPAQIQQLETELQENKQRLAVLEQQLASYDGVWPIVRHDVFPYSKSMLGTMMDTWTTLIQEFPNNLDDRFNHSKGTSARQGYSENKARLDSLEMRHGEATQRLARLRGCDDIVCPSCTHTFKPGVAPDEITLCAKRVSDLAATIAELDSEQIKLKEYIEQYDDYLTFVNRFRTMVRQYDIYRPIWDLAVERRTMFVEPRLHLTEVIRWQTVQTLYIELVERTQRSMHVSEQLERYANVDHSAADYLRKRQEELERKIVTIAERQQDHSLKARGLKSVQDRVDKYGDNLQNITTRLEKYMAQVNQQIVDLVNQGFDVEIKCTGLKLSDLQTKLHRFELREHTLKDIEREHKEAQQWHGDLTLLNKAMSPTDGLIGRYLMGFMQNIVKLLNAVVGEIWTYPMEVLPSKVDKDELDYNFPLNVNNGAVVAPDIARGSSSQRDIVNFAFKLIYMKFMGLEDYPLYLDEFGNTFDEQHRQNLIPFLNKLVEMGQVSQIVYISHFSSSHGAFNHAEVVVLDPTNITTPTTYNTTVKMA